MLIVLLRTDFFVLFWEQICPFGKEKNALYKNKEQKINQNLILQSFLIFFELDTLEFF